MMELSDKEIKRYSRHLNLAEIGLAGQKKLKSASVLVIGAGGLGCPVLQYLTAAGVGKIGIADFDVVEESNLQRQVLYSEADLGNSKAEVAAGKLKVQNPFVEFVIINKKISSENVLEILKDFEIVVDGTDNFTSRYLINDACVITKKPLVFGSILKFEGQLSVFNYNGGPTYRCLYPETPEDAMSCSEAGVLGVLPGIVGTLQANEVIKIITGIGEVLSGKLMVFNLLTLNFSVFQFTSDPENLKISSFISSSEKKSCEIKEISPYELSLKIKNGEDLKIFDLRESYEKEEIGDFEIPLIPLDLSEISLKAEEIENFETAIFICKKGNRSKAAVEFFVRNHGFKNLYSLIGGADEFLEYRKKI